MRDAPPWVIVAAILAGVAFAFGWGGLGSWLITAALTSVIIGGVVAAITRDVRTLPYGAAFGAVLGTFLHVLIRLNLWLS